MPELTPVSTKLELWCNCHGADRRGLYLLVNACFELVRLGFGPDLVSIDDDAVAMGLVPGYKPVTLTPTSGLITVKFFRSNTVAYLDQGCRTTVKSEAQLAEDLVLGFGTQIWVPVSAKPIPGQFLRSIMCASATTLHRNFELESVINATARRLGQAGEAASRLVPALLGGD